MQGRQREGLSPKEDKVRVAMASTQISREVFLSGTIGEDSTHGYESCRPPFLLKLRFQASHGHHRTDRKCQRGLHMGVSEGTISLISMECPDCLALTERRRD